MSADAMNTAATDQIAMFDIIGQITLLAIKAKPRGKFMSDGKPCVNGRWAVLHEEPVDAL